MIDPVGMPHSAPITVPVSLPSPEIRAVSAAAASDETNLQGNSNSAAGRTEFPKKPLAPGTMTGPAPAFSMTVLEAKTRPAPSIPLPAPEATAEAPADPVFQSFAEEPSGPSVDETI